MFDKCIATVTGFIPSLPWILVAVLTGVTIHSLRLGAFSVDIYIQGVVVAFGAAITTALWVGAIDNGSD